MKTLQNSQIVRTIPLLIAVCLVSIPAQAKYSGGSGTADDPYQIATAADLIALGESPADYDKHFILTADIDLAGHVFDKAVIAPDTNPKMDYFQGAAFTGVFDGNGHTISHLTIHGVSYLGLFGQLEERNVVAEVRDLGVVDVNIFGSSDPIGGLVGLNSDGTVVRCYSTGVVDGDDYVGGLVGVNVGSMIRCYNTGAVSGDGSVGGLVGENYYGTVTLCCSTGAVSGNKYIGGLIGSIDSWGIVTQCYSAGGVSGNKYVAGLIGSIDSWGTVTQCYSTGAVIGTKDVGGLVGYNGLDVHVTDSFWDMQTSGQINSAGGTGKTTVEMKDPNTFVATGWDFVGQADGPHDIWAQPEGGGYPILWWQLPPLQGLPRFSGGTGEPNAPYLISTAQQLNSIGYNPRLMLCHFKLIENLDLAGVNFYPVGTFDYPYEGVFDGNNHTISNLMIEGESYLGLLGFLEVGGEIKDLVVADVNITGLGSCVGGLVGYNHCGTVTQCYCTGTISGCLYVGGLVGWNRGTVTQCHSALVVSGDGNVGGLVGSNDGGTLIDCYSKGAVSGDGGVGGLVGWSDGMVTRCHSTGVVSGNEWDVGGLVGYNWGTVSHSYSAGTVSGRYSVGGLIGSNGDMYFAGGIVTACYSTGVVDGNDHVGGLVGLNGGAVTQCYSTRVVSGGWDVGGLVGTNRGSITDSYATGSVTGQLSVGGLAGTNAVSYVSEDGLLGGPEWICISGAVRRCYSSCVVAGSYSKAGLVGDNGCGEINNSLWDIETSGLASMCGNDPNNASGSNDSRGKTTAEMQTAKTFLDAGWDFVGETANGTDDIWAICEGVDYPHLSWEFVIGDFDADADTDFADFCILAEHWLAADSSFWCGGGCDLTNDGSVNWQDLMVFAESWPQQQ